jgi:hypothetical protein
VNAAQTQIQRKTDRNGEDFIHNYQEVQTDQTNERARLQQSKMAATVEGSGQTKKTTIWKRNNATVISAAIAAVR